MDLVKAVFAFAIVFSLAPVGVRAEGLSLTIGNPIAAQGPVRKASSAFIFRVNECADMSKVKITATAEGLMGDARKSSSLSTSLVNPPNVYVVYQQWGTEGKWVVAISTTCGNETAGAVVPVTNTGFVREGTQMFSHAPTAGEIEAALKAFATAAAPTH